MIDTSKTMLNSLSLIKSYIKNKYVQRSIIAFLILDICSVFFFYHNTSHIEGYLEVRNLVGRKLLLNKILLAGDGFELNRELNFQLEKLHGVRFPIGLSKSFGESMPINVKGILVEGHTLNCFGSVSYESPLLVINIKSSTNDNLECKI